MSAEDKYAKGQEEDDTSGISVGPGMSTGNGFARCVELNEVGASPLMKHNAILTSEMTLDEDFVIHQVHQAQIILNSGISRMVCAMCAHEVDTILAQLDRKHAGGHNQVSVWMPRLLTMIEKATSSAFEADGHLLISSLRSHSAPGMAASLIRPAMKSFWLMICASYFHNSGPGRLIKEQETIAFPVDPDVSTRTAADWPNWDQFNSVSLEDLQEFAGPHHLSSALQETLSRTMSEVGTLIGWDGKMVSLGLLLLLVSPQQDGALGKSRHLKKLKSQVTNLMYRYLLAKRKVNQDIAMAAVHRLTGLLDLVHECTRLLGNELAQ